MTEADFPRQLFMREDESSDARFYASPRLVTHIDNATIAALTEWFGEVLAPGSDVLDLMSSWVSHLPEDLALGHVAGLGMNAVELATNARLGEAVVHDLNANPVLPWPDARFDAVHIVVSIQYLVRPVTVFREIARVLRPGGRISVAMSHRLFPTKAIRAFRTLSPEQRVVLVSEYVRRAGGFEEPEFVDRSPDGADPLWIVTARRNN